MSLRSSITILAVLITLISRGAGPKISDFSTNGTLSADDLKRFLIQKRYPSFRMSSVSNEALTQKVFSKPLSEVGIDFRKYHFDPNTNTFSSNEVTAKIKVIDEEGDISL